MLYLEWSDFSDMKALLQKVLSSQGRHCRGSRRRRHWQWLCLVGCPRWAPLSPRQYLHALSTPPNWSHLPIPLVFVHREARVSVSSKESVALQTSLLIFWNVRAFVNGMLKSWLGANKPENLSCLSGAAWTGGVGRTGSSGSSRVRLAPDAPEGFQQTVLWNLLEESPAKKEEKDGQCL